MPKFSFRKLSQQTSQLLDDVIQLTPIKNRGMISGEESGFSEVVVGREYFPDLRD